MSFVVPKILIKFIDRYLSLFPWQQLNSNAIDSPVSQMFILNTTQKQSHASMYANVVINMIIR